MRRRPGRAGVDAAGSLHNRGVTTWRPDIPDRPDSPLLRSEWSNLPGDPDPADRTMIAHATAAAVLRVARDSGSDPERTRRLIGLADDVGIDDIAALWCDAGAATLPGTLWSLYLLRTWVHRDGVEAARLFAAGQRSDEVEVRRDTADRDLPAEEATDGRFQV